MKKSLLIALALAATLVAVAYWQQPRDELADNLRMRERDSYEVVSGSTDPLIRALFSGKIRSGTDIAEATRLVRPVTTEAFGPYSIYNFDEPGYSYRTLIVYRDRIVCAHVGSCTWDWKFFDDLPQSAQTAIAYIRQLRKLVIKHPDLAEDLNQRMEMQIAILGDSIKP